MSDSANDGAMVSRDSSGVLLPAEPAPNLTLTPEQYDAFSRTFRSDINSAVRMVDPLPIASEEKHQIVRDAVVGVGVAKLQGAVKELRGVPPEVLALAADTLISIVVRLIRRAIGGAK